MDIQTQIRNSVRFLEGLEEGHIDKDTLFEIADPLDGVIIAVVFQYLRKKYGTRIESAGVIQRLADFSSSHPQFVKRIKEAEQDPIYEWFDDTHSVSEFFHEPEELIKLIVDKLES